jgi:hypothetical protein
MACRVPVLEPAVDAVTKPNLLVDVKRLVVATFLVVSVPAVVLPKFSTNTVVPLPCADHLQLC